MSDSHDENRADGYQELLPWADPYIVALIEKLRSSQEFADLDHSTIDDDALDDGAIDDAIDELPPPLESDNPNDAWQADWSPRNWPRG